MFQKNTNIQDNVLYSSESFWAFKYSGIASSTRNHNFISIYDSLPRDVCQTMKTKTQTQQKS